MKVKSLSLTNFRNYEKESISFCDDTNVIYGNNAQGKTNILEGIYLFSHGRSHRTKSDTELIKFGSNFARLQIEFKGEYLGIREMRKHVAWYTKGMKGSAKLRDAINLVESYEELEEMLYSKICE